MTKQKFNQELSELIRELNKFTGDDPSWLTARTYAMLAKSMNSVWYLKLARKSLNKMYDYNRQLKLVG